VSRQVFSFGEERVIGPSDWPNMGRILDAVRVDLHHPGFTPRSSHTFYGGWFQVNAGLPETAGRGHLNEVTTSFRLAGQLVGLSGNELHPIAGTVAGPCAQSRDR
jgi:hypothetical protein